MAGPYSTLTDDALAAKITTFEEARDSAALGGGVTDIAGDGRSMKFQTADSKAISSILRELYAERDARSPSTGYCGGGAVGVLIG